MGEAQDLGPQYTYSDELAPLRDKSAGHVSQRLREIAHAAIEGQDPAQAEPA